jgi:TolA-binding protein
MKRRLAMVPALAALLLLAAAVPASALDEADRLFMVGERALGDRYYPVARRALDRFVTQYPRDARLPRALVMLGRVHLALDDPRAALDAITRAQTFPAPPAEQLEAKFWQAETLFRLQRFGEARAAYDEVVRTDAASPLAPEAVYGVGWCELKLNRPEPAVAAFREFLTTWPDHKHAAGATLYLARALADLKRGAEALPLLTTFPAKYPGSPLIPEALFQVGAVKLAGGDVRGGVEDLRSFVAAYPSHELVPGARRLIGQTTGRYGDRQEQQAAYKDFMAQKPATAESLYEAAAIAQRLSQPKDADAAWRRLKSEFPEHPLTRRLALELGGTALKQKHWKDANALGQLAAQSEDDRVRAEGWLLVGESELQLGRYSQAAKAFEAVGALGDSVEAGTRYRALAGLGLARERQKEWKGALSAYEQVASRSPDTGLRDWARARVTAVKEQMPKSTNSRPNGAASKPSGTAPRPADKPAGKKS